MSKVISDCFVVIEITDTHVKALPKIYLSEPNVNPKNPILKVASFKTVFDAKNYIRAFGKQDLISIQVVA